MRETDFSKLVWEQKMMMDLEIIPQGNPWKLAEEQMEENIAYNESVNKNEGFKEVENITVVSNNWHNDHYEN